MARWLGRSGFRSKMASSSSTLQGLPALSTLPVPYRELESLENVFNLNSNPETVDFDIIWLDEVSTCVKTIRLTIQMFIEIEVKIATGDLYFP